MTTTDHSWVLITGASSGFGAEFARQYAAQGHPLVLVARRLDRLHTLAETLRQQYRIDVVVERVDLSDLAAVIQLHQRLRERGIAIDILISCSQRLDSAVQTISATTRESFASPHG